MNHAGLRHQATDQVVGDEKHFQFLVQQGRTLAAQHLHAHRGFDVAKPQFDLPAPRIELRDVPRGISPGIHQCRHQRDRFGPVTLAAQFEAQHPHLQLAGKFLP